MTLRDLTDKQLVRLWSRAVARMRVGDGYQPFGWDWPTMRITKPGWYRALSAINAEGLAREKKGPLDL